MSRIPRVSVCIPTYNRARYLSECIDSILSQSFSDFELIVSDNCSADDTDAVVRSFGDHRIHYSKNPSNMGVTANRNCCLDLARGEYLTILGDDDVYASRFLEREVDVLDRHPGVGFVHCATYEINQEGVRRRLVQAYSEDCVLSGEDQLRLFLCGHNVCCSTVMVRRSVQEVVGCYVPDLLSHDWLMWIELTLRADVAYIAEPLVGMRVHRNSVSSSIQPAVWCDEFLQIAERGLEVAKKVRPELRLSKAEIMEQAAKTQGRRFFIAAMSALTDGAVSEADGYVAVLRKLERWGAPRFYAGLARLFRNQVGRSVLALVRRLRRVWEARELPVGAAQ